MNPDELLKAPNCSGVYYFRNKLNGKYYIGQAERLRRRLRKHVSNAKLSRYDNPLYRAINKYGWENFEWGIFETFTEGTLEERKTKLDIAEEKYIKLYNSYGSTGYNQTRGGDGGIKGYKYTKEQRQHVSENSKKVSRDGRYVIYFYDVKTKQYGQELTLKDFNEKYQVTTRHLKCLLINGRYILARSKEELEEKIKEYYKKIENEGAIKNNGQFVSKLTDEMVEDIKNGMREKDFVLKYSVCRKTYQNYKSQIYKALGKIKKRIYKRKVSLDEYLEYRKEHSRIEAMQHFNITERLSYKYDKQIKDKTNEQLS